MTSEERTRVVEILYRKWMYSLSGLAKMKDEELIRKLQYHEEGEKRLQGASELERNWGRPGAYVSGS